MKRIYLAGGCFWGMEKYFSLAKGVLSTRVGYANGNTDNPSYEDLKSGKDTSAETVEIVYDESLIGLDTLLEYFLRVVDPYSINKQGEDEGLQYRSGVYYENEEDRQTVLDIFSKTLRPDYKIEVRKLQTFYEAEEYHQDYLNKNPGGYCHINMGKLKAEERK